MALALQNGNRNGCKAGFVVRTQIWKDRKEVGFEREGDAEIRYLNYCKLLCGQALLVNRVDLIIRSQPFVVYLQRTTLNSYFRSEPLLMCPVSKRLNPNKDMRTIIQMHTWCVTGVLYPTLKV